ncbi:MAG: hypothetical protein IIY78_07315 [Clostridia bacterium]|nr:hypothetical protein [Clostridia bacterium]
MENESIRDYCIPDFSAAFIVSAIFVLFGTLLIPKGIHGGVYIDQTITIITIMFSYVIAIFTFVYMYAYKKIKFENRFRSYKKENRGDTILNDFERSMPFLNDSVRVGTQGIYGNNTGEFVLLSDVQSLYILRVQDISVTWRVITKAGAKEIIVCTLKRCPPSECNAFFDYIEAVAPNVEVNRNIGLKVTRQPGRQKRYMVFGE